MKTLVIATLGLMALGFILFLGFGEQKVFATVTSTLTITGYNIPDAAHITNGIEGLIIPLIFAEMFALVLRAFDRIGDFHVTLFLTGIALGSLILLFLSSQGTSVAAVPLAFTIVCWLMLVGWLYIGGQGEGSLATGGAG